VQVLVNGNDHRSTLLGVTKPRHDRIDGIANRVKPVRPFKNSNEKLLPLVAEYAMMGAELVLCVKDAPFIHSVNMLTATYHAPRVAI
jgi:hypothetical protein